MRFLSNVNNLLLCSRLPATTTSRFFRWHLPALSTDVTISKRLLNSVESRVNKTFPELTISQHVQRFMSTSSTSNQGKTAQKKVIHFTDDNPELVSVYQGKYTNQILRVKMFSLMTSAVGLVAQPVLFNKGIEVGGTGLGFLMCSVVGIFTFVTPLLLHFVTKKYVIDIKYNRKTDEYTCVTISFFLFKNEINFKVGDIYLPEVETMFTSMKIGPKKVPVFVDAASFNDTHHYARFMGYDKPLDFRIDADEMENSNQSTDQIKSSKTGDK